MCVCRGVFTGGGRTVPDPTPRSKKKKLIRNKIKKTVCVPSILPVNASAATMQDCYLKEISEKLRNVYQIKRNSINIQERADIFLEYCHVL